MRFLDTCLMYCILLCVLCSTLMACGTKGPLYIPEQRYPQETNVPANDASKIETEKTAPNTPTQTKPAN
ncbi:MAG: hypothetical protein CTY37_03190 [Methylotenera sp.]|nr:MAG: hypothetical protein CTY37_03190 [Methylotenera sp.]